MVVSASLVLVLAVAVDYNVSALSGWWHRGEKEDGISAITGWDHGMRSRHCCGMRIEHERELGMSAQHLSPCHARQSLLQGSHRRCLTLWCNYCLQMESLQLKTMSDCFCSVFSALSSQTPSSSPLVPLLMAFLSATRVGPFSFSHLSTYTLFRYGSLLSPPLSQAESLTSRHKVRRSPPAWSVFLFATSPPFLTSSRNKLSRHASPTCSHSHRQALS